MPTVVPAMKCKLGDTTYYILSMKAGELANKVTVPKDLPGWKDKKLEEIYQREINYKRVRNQIAPYFANTSSRFCGAVIVAAINFDEEDKFEPLADLTKINKIYKLAARNIGILNLEDGEVLVPLDGQHRLKAIEFAISGKDNEGKEIDEIKFPCNDLAKEDICVILVPYDNKKSREIFTKVNRYAKTTSTGDNIIIDDNDICAILTREITNKIIKARLVRLHTKSLTGNAIEFTTLATVYECTKTIIEGAFPEKLNKEELPSIERIKLYRDEVFEVWEGLLSDIDIFDVALTDKSEKGDKSRIELRETNLLARPVVQESLFKAYYRLLDEPTGFNHKKACKALNRLPWNIDEEAIDIWQNVFFVGGMEKRAMVAKNRPLAIRMISFMAGEKLSKADEMKLQGDYTELFPESHQKRSIPRFVGD